MKKIKFFKIFLFILIFINCFSINAYAGTPPALNAEGVSIINSNTGQIVYSKNGDSKYFPASTTKVLTALIVIEHCDLDEKVKVGHNPPNADGTSVGIRSGEEYTVRELLCGLILESGNDCACALAEHVSGSNENFAKLMNEKAKELGATHSNFKNPSGLPDEEHYTTPNDLAKIMNACIKNKTFEDICRTTSLKLTASNIDGNSLNISNHNYILLPNSKYYYKYSVCSKKGYTIAAKFTNVISCSKDGNTYVGAFLKGENINTVYSDVENIFNYVFNNYTNSKIYSEGDTLSNIDLEDGTTLPLIIGKDVYYSVNKNDESSIKKNIKYNLPGNLCEKKVKRGEQVATATVYVNNKEVEKIPIVSGKNHNLNKDNEEEEINNSNFFYDYKYILGIIGAFILLFIIRTININKRKSKHKMRKRKKGHEKI